VPAHKPAPSSRASYSSFTANVPPPLPAAAYTRLQRSGQCLGVATPVAIRRSASLSQYEDRHDFFAGEASRSKSAAIRSPYASCLVFRMRSNIERAPGTRMALAEYRALTPFGTAPIITDGDLVLGESGAIIEYIIDACGDGRLKVGQGKMLCRLSLLVHFANGSLMPAAMVDMIAPAFSTPWRRPIQGLCFADLDNLKIETRPAALPRSFFGRDLLSSRFLKRTGMTPENLGLAALKTGHDTPEVRERRSGGANPLHVAIGHRRGQVTLLRHSA
jgi:hypothetical protein